VRDNQTKDRAEADSPTLASCPIEAAVDGLHQPSGGIAAVRAVKGLQYGQCSGGSDFEDYAVAAGSASKGCPIEVAVDSLYKRSDRVPAVARIPGKAVQRGQSSAGRDLKNGALAIRPALPGGSVKVAVGRLDEPGLRVSAITVGEVLQRSQRSAGRDFKDGADGWPEGPAEFSGPVKVAVSPLYESGLRAGTVIAAVLKTKIVQRGQHSGRSHFEDGAPATSPSCVGRSVKVAVTALYERPERRGTVAAVEAVQRGQCARSRNLEDRAHPTGPTRGGCPVEVIVAGLYKPGEREKAVSAVRERTKVVERGQRAIRRDFKGRATAIHAAVRSATTRRSVEVAVLSLD